MPAAPDSRMNWIWFNKFCRYLWNYAIGMYAAMWLGTVEIDLKQYSKRFKWNHFSYAIWSNFWHCGCWANCVCHIYSYACIIRIVIYGLMTAVGIQHSMWPATDRGRDTHTERKLDCATQLRGTSEVTTLLYLDARHEDFFIAPHNVVQTHWIRTLRVVVIIHDVQTFFHSCRFHAGRKRPLPTSVWLDNWGFIMRININETR